MPCSVRKSCKTLWPISKKGVIAPGSDADLVIMRTGVEDVITAKDQVQNVDYAPFEGKR